MSKKQDVTLKAFIETLMESTLTPYNYLDKELQEAGEGIRTDDNGIPFWCRSAVWLARDLYNEFQFSGAHAQLTKLQTELQAAEVVAAKDCTTIEHAFNDTHRASPYRPDPYDFCLEEIGKYQTQVEMLTQLRTIIEEKFLAMTGYNIDQFIKPVARNAASGNKLTSAEEKLAAIKARMKKAS